MRFVVFVFVFEFVHHALWINRGRLSNLRGRWYLSLPVSLCCSPHTDRMKLTSFGGSAATDVDMVATVIIPTMKLSLHTSMSSRIASWLGCSGKVNWSFGWRETEKTVCWAGIYCDVK